MRKPMNRALKWGADRISMDQTVQFDSGTGCTGLYSRAWLSMDEAALTEVWGTVDTYL